MKISIVGTGYVGAVTGSCLAELGHSVLFVDIDKKKLDLIENCKSPVFEPGLEEIIKGNKERIRTTTRLSDAVPATELVFICVGTPPLSDGSSDLQQIRDVAEQIGASLKSSEEFPIIIIKSTVLPGTIESIIIPILEKHSGKRAFKDFGIASNPEFLKEGSAVEDFFHTDRIVIGVKDDLSKTKLEQLYLPLNSPVFITTIQTAEMIKFASNAFLATKISFSNEIGNLCKVLGIDSHDVFSGVGLDTRINPCFFRSGLGFGGSCFPKDVHALMYHAKQYGVEPRILKSVIQINDDQPKKMVALLEKHLNPEGRTIGILGLAFKPNTDDIRESRAEYVVRLLLESGANVIVYDPIAMDNFRRRFPNLRYAQSATDVMESDAILIITEWKEFEGLDYRGKIVIDGRRLEKAKQEAKIYEGVCW